jgi:hypothetical protein
VFDDFGGGASVEYFRNEERKEALGTRAEVRGARRREAMKEFTTGFMMVMVVVRNERRGDEGSVEASKERPRVIYTGD